MFRLAGPSQVPRHELLLGQSTVGVLPYKPGFQRYPEGISDRRSLLLGFFASPPPNHQSPVPLHHLEGVEGDVVVSFEGEVVDCFEGEVVVGFEGNGERGERVEIVVVGFEGNGERGDMGKGGEPDVTISLYSVLSQICDHQGFEGDGGRWGTLAEAQRLL